jgi:hypothetical protein
MPAEFSRDLQGDSRHVTAQSAAHGACCVVAYCYTERQFPAAIAGLEMAHNGGGA